MTSNDDNGVGFQSTTDAIISFRVSDSDAMRTKDVSITIGGHSLKNCLHYLQKVLEMSRIIGIDEKNSRRRNKDRNR